ncbi:hypothetical protein [Rubripirellula lacrimiformis]|uniref:hypothetical protein n=1 Tax=Rubripirellula lacrimiformis TaxID=1930273 RepID=UPI0011A2C85D|nr:hypothetical protein [Rubripirellula lacrimiformis]
MNTKSIWTLAAGIFFQISFTGCSGKTSQFSFINSSGHKVFVETLAPINPKIACGLLGEYESSATVPPEYVPEQLTLTWFKVDSEGIARETPIIEQISIGNFDSSTDRTCLEIAYRGENKWEARFKGHLASAGSE